MADFAHWGEAVGRAWAGLSSRSGRPMLGTAGWRLTSVDDSAVAEVLFDSVPSNLKWSGNRSDCTASSGDCRKQVAGSRGDGRKTSPDSSSGFADSAPASRARAWRLPLAESRKQSLITLTFDNNWLLATPSRNDRPSSKLPPKKGRWPG